MTQTSQSSLSDELAAAPDLDALNALIEKGRTYFASRRTRNRWQRVAEQRRAELSKSLPSPESLSTP